MRRDTARPAGHVGGSSRHSTKRVFAVAAGASALVVAAVLAAAMPEVAVLAAAAALTAGSVGRAVRRTLRDRRDDDGTRVCVPGSDTCVEV